MQTQPSVVETTRDARIQLEFIDGLRAVSALLVVAHHAFLFTGHTGDAEAAMPAAGKLFEHLNEAVPVFIVLSAFVLLPRGMNLKGKLGRYIYRRSRRILPPYYAALAVFALLIAVVPALHQQHGTAWDDKIPVTATSTMAHVFMVHNLSLSTAYTFDGPMWSVATEYQIYFLLPLVLLPLWRRFNRWVMLAATVAFALAIPVAAPALNQAHLWFVALFAFGLVARSLVNERTIPRWAPVAASVARTWRPPKGRLDLPPRPYRNFNTNLIPGTPAHYAGDTHKRAHARWADAAARRRIERRYAPTAGSYRALCVGVSEFACTVTAAPKAPHFAAPHSPQSEPRR
jgi:peptidoglycan/LPS O-acetylase OafA/YrhL